MSKDELEKKLQEAKTKYGRDFEAHLPKNYKRITPKSYLLRKLEKSCN